MRLLLGAGGASRRAQARSLTLPCANPRCSVDSLYFRNGSLHWIDVETSEGSSTAAVNQQIVWLRAASCTDGTAKRYRESGAQ